jgi:hypothetical protein
VFSWILDDFEKGPKTKQDRLNLEGDGYLIVVAGRYEYFLSGRFSSGGITKP